MICLTGLALLTLFRLSAVLANVPSSFGRLDGFRFSPLIANTNRTPDDALRKRDLTWQQALDDGGDILAKLAGPGQQSVWSTVQQLTDNGWTVTDAEPDYQTNEYYGGANGPYNTLHIRQSTGYQVIAKQDRSFSNCHSDDVERTLGLYRNIYNVVGRTIVGTYNYSPLYYAAMNHPGPDLSPYVPRVYQYSDIMFILWADQVRHYGVAASTLRYIFKHEIVTPSTRNIMRAAAGLEMIPEEDQDPKEPEQGEQLEVPWPGHQFLPGTQEFQALMGTPHGKGIAYLILQHRNEMPGKTIESITMFTTGDDEEYSLLFTLTEK
ncbi:MAG: hypothetical protein Q9218_002282 [Villophora microphyllina]